LFIVIGITFGMSSCDFICSFCEDSTTSSSSIPENTRIILSLTDLSAECEGGVECLKIYPGKEDIIGHAGLADQATSDPAYTGYEYCEGGSVPGSVCNEPPGGTGFTPASRVEFTSNFDQRSKLVADLNSINDVTHLDDFMVFTSEEDEATHADGFLTLCVLELSGTITDFEKLYEKYADLSCSTKELRCMDLSESSIDHFECFSVEGSITEPEGFGSGISVDAFTMQIDHLNSVHVEDGAETSTLYITILKTDISDKVFRISYSSPEKVRNRFLLPL
ncbi:MAG: hypothetical protein AAFY45_14690, partial [Bacteroidota bacterium]